LPPTQDYTPSRAKGCRCYPSRKAPTIAMEILSKDELNDYTKNYETYFSYLNPLFMCSLWKDCNGKRDPKGGAQILFEQIGLIFS